MITSDKVIEMQQSSPGLLSLGQSDYMTKCIEFEKPSKNKQKSLGKVWHGVHLKWTTASQTWHKHTFIATSELVYRYTAKKVNQQPKTVDKALKNVYKKLLFTECKLYFKYGLDFFLNK